MTNEPIVTPISAAARIIGDISTGIYRSPANALKELVSNSFDAGATEVVISTDQPGFSSVSCFDNGPGISIDKLKEVFEFIGGSNKRWQSETGRFGRPLIGKIGIGILAMSQISKRFVIISSREGDDYRIEAEVNVEEFETDAAARRNLGPGEIGQCRIYKIPEPQERHYTIVSTSSGSELVRENLGTGPSSRKPFVKRSYDSENFEEFVRKVGDAKRRETLNDYEVFLWELASLCPVPYFEEGPVKGWSGWDHIKQRLENYKFRVTVDGYELRKPVLLPSRDELAYWDDDFKVYPFSSKGTVEGGLRFQGYILHQRTQISPPELQGLLVRIKNVGIGRYETNMLNYPTNLGPMVHGMSGEVYVDAGLEEALNIDRNSFNETHDHYNKLRDVLFEHLGLPGEGGITQNIRQRSQNRQQGLHRDKTFKRLETLVQRLGKITGKSWQLSKDQNIDYPLTLDNSSHSVRVNVEHGLVPSGLAAKREFYRVYLSARLAESYGPPAGEEDAFLGWLSRL